MTATEARVRRTSPGSCSRTVLRADDALRAVEYGADGVVLSNHGGRRLDGAITAIHALSEVARETGGRASIIIDGGVELTSPRLWHLGPKR